MTTPFTHSDNIPFRTRVITFLRRLRNFSAEQVKHYYYLITTNGLAISNQTKTNWEQKWKKPSTMKVLLLAPRDYAGSFYRWAKAVNTLDSGVSCRMVSLFKHRYDYDFDYIFHAFRKGISAHKDFQRLVDEADALHLKDEFFFYYHNKFPRVSAFMVSLINEFKRKNKPVIFTLYGSFARKLQHESEYRRSILDFDARIALTPDLNYEWFDGYYVPHAFDLNQFPYTWSESKIFAHSPSSRQIKGSDSMLKALKQIKKFGNEWEIDIIENVRYEKCLERKSKAELFFDQAGRVGSQRTDDNEIIGWYGNSAIEAMAYGIPTIGHLSQTAFQQSKNAGKDIRERCPILNTGLDEEAMAQTVNQYLTLSHEDRIKLSQKTRQWVQDFHSEEVVGKELITIYKSCT